MHIPFPYFFFAGFAVLLLFGSFLDPHPHAMVIPPLRTTG